MLQRSQDFAASARSYLMACRVQWESVEEEEPGATLEDLRWYMASYASVKAGELSQAQQWALLNVLDARKRNREGFKRLEYLVDRTEGKAAQQISIQQVETPKPLVHVKLGRHASTDHDAD